MGAGAMSGTMARLPPGFVLDEPVTPAQAPPDSSLPPGFVLDPPQEPQSWGGTAMDIVQQAARGATFGFGDELAAGVGATVAPLAGVGGTWQERYDRMLADNRARQKKFEGQHPWAALGAQVAGAVANPVSRLSAGSNFLSRMGSNALINGLLGGVTGFGEGEGGFVNRLGPAGTGAATGAVLGAAIPAIGEGAANLVRKAAPSLGVNVAATDAKRGIIDALKAGGVGLDDVKTQLDAATGQPMALVDVGGEALMGRAQTASRTPGPAMTAAKEFVDQRGGLNQSARVEGEIKRAISAQDFTSAADDLIRTRAATAGPLYERALANETPVNVQPILDDITARLGTAKGDIRSALQKAAGLFKGRDGKPDTTLAGLHETKLALDALLEKTPTNSVSRVARRELAEVQTRLVQAMDEASGGAYGQAREAFAGPSRAMDAMDLGKRVLRGDADETAAEIAKLSPSERDFFRIGVARALVDKVKGTNDTADITAVNKIWGSQAVRERVAAAFDDPKEFERFASFMDNELKMARTNAEVNPRGNSITAKLLMQNAEPAPVGPVFQALRSTLRNDPLGFAASLMPQRQATGSLNAQTAAEMAPMLFAMKPGDRARMIDALMKQEARDTKVKRIADPVANALMRGGVVGAVQLEN